MPIMFELWLIKGSHSVAGRFFQPGKHSIQIAPKTFFSSKYHQLILGFHNFFLIIIDPERLSVYYQMYPKIQNNAEQQIIEKCIRSLKSSTGRNSTQSSLLSRSRRPQTNFNLTGSSVFLQSTVHLFARHSDYLWIYFDCLSFDK